jgi:outer membrane immunogenic protein
MLIVIVCSNDPLCMVLILSRGPKVKKLLLAATAIVSAVTITTAARAADIAPAAYDWSGFYFGVNAGAAWNNSDIDNSFEYTGGDIDLGGPAGPEILADDINAALNEFGDNLGGDDAVFTGGALFGYNWQHDSLVFGVEADINYVGFSEENSREFNDVDFPFITGDSSDGSSKLSFDANWYGTLRGRLGFAADNLLIYGTGGLAYGHMEASAEAELSDGVESVRYGASTDSTNWGWTAGAGIEYGIDNWSLGLEYLYVDLGSAEWDADLSETVVDSDISDAIAQITGSGDVDYQFSVVRATAKIRF